jgi:hypothetical protein
MRAITDTLYRNLKSYQKGCSFFKQSVCSRLGGCRCWLWSEVWAYIDSVVPDEYRHFTIQDFTGLRDGDQLLSPKIVKAARDVLVEYVWNGIASNQDYDETWLTKCVLNKRFEEGSSLIIYGDPWKQSTSGNNRPFRKPLGRTMLAAIVMKEVIFQRLLPGHSSDSYAWVHFQTLCHRLMDKANGNKDYDAEIASYEQADWLVVDGIQMLPSTDAMRGFKASVLEKLFGERVENKLPNILVFQDDVSKFDDLQFDFGPSINSIINSRKTHRVAMLDKK